MKQQNKTDRVKFLLFYHNRPINNFEAIVKTIFKQRLINCPPKQANSNSVNDFVKNFNSWVHNKSTNTRKIKIKCTLYSNNQKNKHKYPQKLVNYTTAKSILKIRNCDNEGTPFLLSRVI